MQARICVCVVICHWYSCQSYVLGSPSVRMVSITEHLNVMITAPIIKVISKNEDMSCHVVVLSQLNCPCAAHGSRTSAESKPGDPYRCLYCELPSGTRPWDPQPIRNPPSDRRPCNALSQPFLTHCHPHQAPFTAHDESDWLKAISATDI